MDAEIFREPARFFDTRNESQMFAAERSAELCARLGAPVIGVALNGAKEAPLPKGYYRYSANLFGLKKA